MTSRTRSSARRPKKPAPQRVSAHDVVKLFTALAGAVGAVAGAITTVATHPAAVEEVMQWFHRLFS